MLPEPRYAIFTTYFLLGNTKYRDRKGVCDQRNESLFQRKILHI
jgi:hypothetical protein